MSASRNWAAVATPHAIYIGIVDRDEFERIALPANPVITHADGRSVVTKTLGKTTGVRVIFQHWLQ